MFLNVINANMLIYAFIYGYMKTQITLIQREGVLLLSLFGVNICYRFLRFLSNQQHCSFLSHFLFFLCVVSYNVCEEGGMSSYEHVSSLPRLLFVYCQ